MCELLLLMVKNKEDKTEYGWGNHQRKKQGYSKATKQQSTVISKALRSDSITHGRTKKSLNRRCIKYSK